MSLQTGAEMISLALLFNKVTGLYGLIAILTGYSLSALQLSLYLYSLVALVLLALIMPHIRKQSPLENMALAWFYLLDTVVNTAWTSAFAISWYMSSTANAAAEQAAAAIDGGPSTQRTAADIAEGSNNWNSTSATGDLAITKALAVQETATSITLIVAFTLIRVYFSLVVMAYARQVVLRFVDSQTGWDQDDAKTGLAVRPEAVGSAMGNGWRRRIGTVMLKVGQRYWLGVKGDEEWARDASARLGRGQRTNGGAPRSATRGS
jgi:hypothetical protein